jgi:hypothetical protein
MGSDHLSVADSARIAGQVVPPALIGADCELARGARPAAS